MCAFKSNGCTQPTNPCTRDTAYHFLHIEKHLTAQVRASSLWLHISHNECQSVAVWISLISARVPMELPMSRMMELYVMYPYPTWIQKTYISISHFTYPTPISHSKINLFLGYPTHIPGYHRHSLTVSKACVLGRCGDTSASHGRNFHVCLSSVIHCRGAGCVRVSGWTRAGTLYVVTDATAYD